MSRSSKKGPYVDAKLMKKVEKAKISGDRKGIKTWARACTVVPEFIGQVFLVHNGKKFQAVHVNENMIGHKLGEFVPTRVFKGHGAAHTKEANALT